MISILFRDYPEIAQRIKAGIQSKEDEEMPSFVLRSFELIPDIVEGFKKAKGIQEIIWVTQNGQKSRKRIVENRELLVAVILLFYDPERILGLKVSPKSKNGLVKAIAQYANCKPNPISDSAVKAIFAFKVYKDFKEEVTLLYEIIKDSQRIYTKNKLYETKKHVQKDQ